jgi:hypothetical protein
VGQFRFDDWWIYGKYIFSQGNSAKRDQMKRKTTVFPKKLSPGSDNQSLLTSPDDTL